MMMLVDSVISGVIDRHRWQGIVYNGPHEENDSLLKGRTETWSERSDGNPPFCATAQNDVSDEVK